MASSATALSLRRRRVAAPPSPFLGSSSKAAAAGTTIPAPLSLLHPYSSKAKAIRGLMDAAVDLALLMASALPGAAASSNIVRQDDEGPKIPSCSSDFVQDGQLCNTIPDIEADLKLLRDKYNIMEALKEQAEMLEEWEHNIEKDITGKEASMVFYVELTGLLKNYCDFDRLCAELLSNSEELLWSFSNVHLDILKFSTSTYDPQAGFCLNC